MRAAEDPDDARRPHHSGANPRIEQQNQTAARRAVACRRYDTPAQLRQMRAAQYGQGCLQIDHMKVAVANVCCCVVFAARGWLGSAVCAMAAADATLAVAARFLDRVSTVMPFTVEQIQTDGGSEFKGVFEAACRARGSPLYIIPPRSPKYNSKVKNMNETIRREVFNFRDERGRLRYAPRWNILMLFYNRLKTPPPEFPYERDLRTDTEIRMTI